MDDLNRALYWGIDCSPQPEISPEALEEIEDILWDYVESQ